MFLDPKKPLYTCNKQECDTCEIKSRINCHFNKRQVIGFLAFASPSFLIGGIGIWLFNPLFLIPWIIMFFSFFMFIEIRVMCSHCPHYAEPEIKTLKCWANYGAPKIWKYRPGPMSLYEKIIFFLGLSLIIIYPYIFFLFSKNHIIIIIYSIMIFIGFLMLLSFLCVRCMNFACPFNRVDENIRRKFFNNNLIVKRAWEKRFNN
jgi:hypothetical protein